MLHTCLGQYAGFEPVMATLTKFIILVFIASLPHTTLSPAVSQLNITNKKIPWRIQI